MPSKYNRTLEGCWTREQIEQAIESRLAELNGDQQKSKTRIRFLKGKISKLKKALEDGTPVGGNIKRKDDRGVSQDRNKAVYHAKGTHKRVRKICFKCRKRGHTLHECQGEDGSICFRCGSKDHILRNCQAPDTGSLPFTTCFVCQEVGHLSSHCPENEKGIYPNGGACFFCGSVTHRKIDCPERQKKIDKPT